MVRAISTGEETATFTPSHRGCLCTLIYPVENLTPSRPTGHTSAVLTETKPLKISLKGSMPGQHLSATVAAGDAHQNSEALPIVPRNPLPKIRGYPCHPNQSNKAHLCASRDVHMNSIEIDTVKYYGRETEVNTA